MSGFIDVYAWVLALAQVVSRAIANCQSADSIPLEAQEISAIPPMFDGCSHFRDTYNHRFPRSAPPCIVAESLSHYSHWGTTQPGVKFVVRGPL